MGNGQNAPGRILPRGHNVIGQTTGPNAPLRGQNYSHMSFDCGDAQHYNIICTKYKRLYAICRRSRRSLICDNRFIGK